MSREHPGHPFASVMPYALDDCGRPLMLISSVAMHTQNLTADARASLLVTQPTAGDPLAAGRLTLMGEAAVPEAEIERASVAYLARHDKRNLLGRLRRLRLLAPRAHRPLLRGWLRCHGLSATEYEARIGPRAPRTG